jgi:phage gp29-like protein
MATPRMGIPNGRVRGYQAKSSAITSQASRPPAGEIVTEDILYLRQMSTLGQTLAFAGQTNPSNIWAAMVRDDQLAYGYYRELEEKDEDISSALDKLKLGVLYRERGVTPADDSQQALDVATFVETQLNALPNLHVILDNMLDAAGYGVTIAELIFDISAGQVAISEIKDRPQDLFLFNPRMWPQNGPLRLLPAIYDLEGQPVPETKFLVFSYRPRNGIRRGRPLLRSVFWPSWFKRNGLKFWLRYAEKGPGTAVVKYPQGGGPDEQKKALQAAEAVINSIAVAVPENFEVVEKLLVSARAQNPSVYENLCKEMQYAITRRILGQTLTSFANEGGTGSKAMGGVHQDQGSEKEIELARALECVINEQLVRPLVMWNFGPNAPMPTWQVNKDDDEDLRQRVLIDDTLQAMGFPISQNYVSERYDIPLPGTGDVTLARTQGTLATTTPVGSATRGAFSEAERIAARQIGDVDRLIGQLQGKAFPMFKQRVLDLVGAEAGAR